MYVRYCMIIIQNMQKYFKGPLSNDENITKFVLNIGFIGLLWAFLWEFIWIGVGDAISDGILLRKTKNKTSNIKNLSNRN